MSVLQKCLDGVYYESAKLVTVKHLKISLFHRFVQLIILTAVIFGTIWSSGYQQDYSMTGEVSFFPLPSAFISLTVSSTKNHTYDCFDLILIENNEVFFTTAISLPIVQQQGVCPSRMDFCNNDTDCKGGVMGRGGIIQANQCNKRDEFGDRFCNVSSWCPASHYDNRDIIPFNPSDLMNRMKLLVSPFEVIDEYPGYIVPSLAKESDILFSFGHLLDIAKVNINDNDTISKLFTSGAIFVIYYQWDCNMDMEPSQGCKLTMRSEQIPLNMNGALFSSTTKVAYIEEGKRVTTHFRGIKFIFKNIGTARKFSFFELFFTLGSGFAFFAFANILTDFILTYLHPNRDEFNDASHDNFQATNNLNNNNIQTNYKKNKNINQHDHNYRGSFHVEYKGSDENERTQLFNPMDDGK